MTDQSELKMEFDPKVIKHLGVHLYSTLPPVLSELIANSYDADAKNVRVKLYDKGEKKIVVEDDGIGMSLEDIRDKFLVIGRDRRQEENNRKTPGGRKPIGKKGLGKLSFFGVVNTITVDTIKNKRKNVFEMDWENLMTSSGEYFVVHKVKNEFVNKRSQTKITLTNSKRKGNFASEGIANSISRFFIFDRDFTVMIVHNDRDAVQVTNEMRFNLLNPQFTWSFPECMRKTPQYPYLEKNKITGKILTSEAPIPPSMKARGIALFSRQKLVQAPTYFAESTSSHFFSYLSGWLEVDFIDDIPEDVISTNRLSLHREHPSVRQLESVLQTCISHIQKEWRAKRVAINTKKAGKHVPREWLSSLPANLREKVKNHLKQLVEISAAEEDELNKVVSSLLEIIPPYPFYHWRHLHERLQDQLFDSYKRKDYLGAARDGVQIYEDVVVEKSLLKRDGVDLYRHAFAGEHKKLEVRHPFLQKKTDDNIQQGQQSLSVGLVESFRNPVVHNTRRNSHKFFTEDDCLDVLSLISFLLRRVDKAKKIKSVKKPHKGKKQ